MPSVEKTVHVEENIGERAEESWGFQFPVVNQQFCILSIVDTTGDATGSSPPPSSSASAIKIFGCYPSEEAANAAAAKISSECDFFHVYVCPTGSWVPVPPRPEMIEDVRYQETRLTEIQEAFVALRERRAKEVVRHLEKGERELEAVSGCRPRGTTSCT